MKIYNDKTLSLINEIKREQVVSCINVVSKYKFVKRLIVFGSSVTDYCTEESDIDLCIDMEGSTIGMHTFYLDTDLCKACNYNCDILTYHKLSGRIKEEIDNKGIVVYNILQQAAVSNKEEILRG